MTTGVTGTSSWSPSMPVGVGGDLVHDVHAGEDAAEHGVAEVVGRVAAVVERGLFATLM